MAKFQIIDLDLLTNSFEVMQAEAGDPTNAYVATIQDLEPEETEGAFKFYQERLKVNGDGSWMIDCEESMILIIQLPEQ